MDCITTFYKGSEHQKLNLLVFAMLRSMIPVMLRSPLCIVHSENHLLNKDSRNKVLDARAI